MNDDADPHKARRPGGRKFTEVGRLPPHSPEAEQGVLGCCLLDGTVMGDCLEKLGGPEAFYDLRHRELYCVLAELYEARVAIDVLTVHEALKTRSKLAAVGGLEYVTALPERVPSAYHLPQYLEIVREKYLLRRMLQACTAAIGRIYEEGGEVDALFDGIERDLLAVNEARVEAKEVRLKDALQHVVERIEDYQRGKAQMEGLPTGFEYLDKMLLGMGPGDMIVIAARPGLGKTSIGMQIIGHLAREKNVPCAVFTMEMTANQLAARLLFQQSRCDFQRYRSGYLENTDVPKLIETNLALMRAPVLLDETPAINVLQLRARARRFHHQHKIGCILVDYVQLMRPSRFYNNREQEVAEISGGIKQLAKELSIPIIVLAQLNRDLEKSSRRRPQLSDLRESGAIEQDADVVAMLYSPKLEKEEIAELELKGQDWSDNWRRINLLVAKQRNGPTGDCKLLYRKKSMRFESLFEKPKRPGEAEE